MNRLAVTVLTLLAATWPNKPAVQEDGRVLVTEYGAVADGTTDDTAAFKKAIDALPSGGVVVVPASDKAYTLAGLTVKTGVQVSAVGAIIMPAADVDLITMKPGASWIGGFLDCRSKGFYFKHSVFVFDGADMYNVDAPRTFVRDARIENWNGAITYGTAIDMRSLGADGIVYGILVENVTVKGFEYGIRQRRSGALAANSITGNTFSHVWLLGTWHGISQEQPGAGYIDGNRFLDFDYQYGSSIVKGIVIAGSGNTIESQFWDWPTTVEGTVAVEYAAGTTNNVGRYTGIDSHRISDAGAGNTYYNGSDRVLRLGAVVFNDLTATTAVNGMLAYCSNCTVENPCATGGTGALAKRLNGAWVCN